MRGGVGAGEPRRPAQRCGGEAHPLTHAHFLQQLLTDSAGVKCQTAEEGDTTDWKARALAAEQQCQATQRELTGLEEATTTRPFNPASVSCLMQRSFAQEVTDTLLSWPLTCRADGWQ